MYAGGERTIIRPNGNRELVMSNHLGSTACIFPLTGVNNTPIAQQVTDAYGIPLTLQGAADPQRSRTSFIGRDVDKESDLGAFGARLYSSEYGRFVAVDILREDDQQSTSYGYTRNRPTTRIDVNGLRWFDVDGNGTWVYLDGVDEHYVARTNEDGETVMVKVTGQKELLVFDGSTPTWCKEDGSTRSWDAVSGKLVNGKTDPSKQDVADKGPIPSGEYYVDFSETVEHSKLLWYRKLYYQQSSWGNYFVGIKPNKVANGRSGFTIHGGEIAGSEGCIDLHKNNDNFFGYMLNQTKKLMPLFVSYE